MRSYDIATTPHPWRNKSPDAVQNFIQFVKETGDSVIKGLVSLMAEEIQHHRLDGRLYMGENSVDINECVAASEVLLARVLLDKSSHGDPPGYVKPQLNNIAWYIATREQGRDSVKNWIMAERRYVREGLEYLTELQKPKPVETEKAA